MTICQHLRQLVLRGFALEIDYSTQSNNIIKSEHLKIWKKPERNDTSHGVFIRVYALHNIT